MRCFVSDLPRRNFALVFSFWTYLTLCAVKTQKGYFTILVFSLDNFKLDLFVFKLCGKRIFFVPQWQRHAFSLGYSSS